MGWFSKTLDVTDVSNGHGDYDYKVNKVWRHLQKLEPFETQEFWVRSQMAYAKANNNGTAGALLQDAVIWLRQKLQTPEANKLVEYVAKEVKHFNK